MSEPKANSLQLRAAFSPDGTHVFTASDDGRSRVWRVLPMSTHSSACPAGLTRCLSQAQRDAYGLFTSTRPRTAISSRRPRRTAAAPADRQSTHKVVHPSPRATAPERPGRLVMDGRSIGKIVSAKMCCTKAEIKLCSGVDGNSG